MPKKKKKKKKDKQTNQTKVTLTHRLTFSRQELETTAKISLEKARTTDRRQRGSAREGSVSHDLLFMLGKAVPSSFASP
jgi:recombinational DNA repair ATPase RecF